MTVFVDASAIVAVMTNEVGRAPRMWEAMRSSPDLATNGLALWEASAAILRKMREESPNVSMDDVLAHLDAFCEDRGIVRCEPHADDWRLAALAFERYGARSGSRARLNMADCFHYAVARRLGAAILFTSPDEFHHTDLQIALPAS